MGTSASPHRRRFAVLAVFALAALGAWLLLSRGRQVPGIEEGAARVARDTPAAAPSLTGVPRPTAPDPAPSPREQPAVPAPSKSAVQLGTGAPRYEDTLPKVRVRLVLEGTGDAVVPRTVLQGGNEYLADQPVPLEPGGWIHVRTDDPRAAVPIVSKRLPREVPAEVSILVPRADDARLARLTLRAVDAVSRAPLPRAYLDLGPRGCDAVPRITADAEGRIAVDRELLSSCRAAGGTLAGLASAIYEPDHRPPGLREAVPALGEETLAVWLERGEIEVPLEPLETDEGRPARVRLVSDRGEPVAGMAVRGLVPGIPGGVMALRSDAAGLVLWERAPAFFGLLLHDAGGARAYVVLARRDAPVELRLPRWGDVELEISGVPPGARLQPRWDLTPEIRDHLDAVDPARPDAYVVNGVPRAPGRMVTDRYPAPWIHAQPLASAPARFLCRLPLGVRTRVLLADRQNLDVEPQRDGERIAVAWDDLAQDR